MKTNITVNIEISKDSKIKYEYDRKQGKIVVDRILREGFTYPANYGYVSEALDFDGDELDVLVYSEESFQPGVSLQARIVGAMKMIDQGETDTKLVAVHTDDYRLEGIKTLDDIPRKWLKQVETFFTTYKNWKGEGITSVSGFEGTTYALAEYQECVELMNKYGSMNKDDFISKMKEIHPDRYK